MKVEVLRLGHRYSRDKRISTHVALVARALGANKILMDSHDSALERSIRKVVEEWGGNFKIEFIPDWRKYLRNFNGDRIHLTMYGIGVDSVIKDITSSGKDKLIIVGGRKVPADVYSMAGYNVAIGDQPHSEIAALAVFLDRLFQGKGLTRDFKGRKKIVPQEHGKKLLE